MSKRKAEDLFGGSNGAKEVPAARVAQFHEDVRALNAQFAAWVDANKTKHANTLWDAGLRDYLKHSEKLKKDYDDVLRSTLISSAEPPPSAGRIYVMGQGDMGQLGLGEGEEDSEALRPRLLLISGGLRVLQVACGGMHTICITEDGGIFSWGVNDEGALGREARGGELAKMDGETAGSESVPERVDAFTSERIQSISAGDSHSVALTAEGKVFAWGVFRDSGGRFGFSATSGMQRSPTHVPIGREKVKQISSGSDHIAALTAGGTIYTWGCAECGRLGRLKPEECDAKAQRKDAGQWKSMLLTPAPVTLAGRPGTERKKSSQSVKPRCVIT